MKRFESANSSPERQSQLSHEQSPAVPAALSVYMEHAGGYADPELPARAARVVETLSSYAPEGLPQHALDAAMMQEVADQIRQPNQPVRNRAAGLSFSSYFSHPKRRSQSNAYVGTLEGDLPHIDAGASTFRMRADNRMLRMLDGNEKITEDDWTNLRVGANIPEMSKVARVTNIESQLARTALIVDRIMYAGDNDQKTLEYIIWIESYLAAFLEIYGFHAFDMMAQSSAGKVRVLKSGREDVLEHALQTLNTAKQISTEDIISQFFGNHPKAHIFQTAKEALYGEEIIFSTTALSELSTGQQNGELHTRFKSVGKYALKLLRNSRYDVDDPALLPADVFGMLSVVPDTASLGVFFADTVEQIRKNPAINLAKSASKKRPIYIQGSKAFVDQISQQLPSDVLDRYVQPKVIKNLPVDHIYQVAKFTSTLSMNGQELPVEFQFQTRRDRMNARLGVPAHMNHNAGDGIASIVPGTPQEMHAIFMRKHDIDPNGELVNSNSIIHGEEFRRQYEHALGRRIV